MDEETCGQQTTHQEEVKGIIYCAVNKVNGKCYVGKTIGSLIRRQKAHESLSRNNSTTHFHKAMKKHGFYNFEWSILEFCPNLETLNSQEIFWINHLSSEYNEAMGGKGGTFTESHKQKISSALKGVPKSESHKRALSLAKMGKKISEDKKHNFRKFGKDNHFFGRTHSDQSKKLIGLKSKNRNWASGSKCHSYKDVDRKIILECYFKLLPLDSVIQIVLEKTDKKIGKKCIRRVWKELGLCSPSKRGKSAINEIAYFVKNNDIKTFLQKIKEFEK